MKTEYFIEKTNDPVKFVYRHGGEPRFAMWSYKDKNWIPIIDEDDYEEVFLMHNRVEAVDEKTALQQISISGKYCLSE